MSWHTQSSKAGNTGELLFWMVTTCPPHNRNNMSNFASCCNKTNLFATLFYELFNKMLQRIKLHVSVKMAMHYLPKDPATKSWKLGILFVLKLVIAFFNPKFSNNPPLRPGLLLAHPWSTNAPPMAKLGPPMALPWLLSSPPSRWDACSHGRPSSQWTATRPTCVVSI